MPNHFGKEIPNFKQILADPLVEGFIREKLNQVFGKLGAKPNARKTLIDETLRPAQTQKEPNYEAKARALFEKSGLLKGMQKGLRDRSAIIARQVGKHLPRGRVLDYGCGDGLAGGILSKAGWDVNFTDVYIHPAMAGNPHFSLIGQSGKMPFPDGHFKGAILAAVLHHANNPAHVLKEACRVLEKGGKLIIIESVHGIRPSDLKGASLKRSAGSYAALTTEQQRCASMFFDHFYNRIVHYSADPKKKVNLPHNLSTPQNWEQFFERHGFRQLLVEHNGFDHLPAMEYHTLHVLEKK